ncbi:MAG: type II secretion system protein N [Lysobacter sp.]
MKRRMLAAALGAAYALALIATAPATLIDARLQRASDGRLRLAEAQGTLWSGTGQLEIRDARGRAGSAKRVAWRFLPAALLRARLAYEVGLDSGSRAFPVTIFWSRIELADADIGLPAGALGHLVPKLATLGLTGDLTVHIPRLSIGPGATRGSATVQWRGAGSALSPVSPLGDYELRITGDGPTVRTTLQTLQGPLQLDGQGVWADGRPPEFLASARLPPEFRQRLAPFLRLITVERTDGSFEFRLP